jgi:hypothetical protein
VAHAHAGQESETAPPQPDDARQAPAHTTGGLDAQTLLRLQQSAGNAAVGRIVARSRGGLRPSRPAAGAMPPPRAAIHSVPGPSGARRLQRSPYPVVPEMELDDQTRQWFDPADKTAKPVWTAADGYAKNPSARPLNDLLKPNGRIGGGFDNGVFTYVVDEHGNVIVAKRLGEPGGRPGRATGMPHPTLIGGKKPTVLAAGEVEIRAGRIYRIDNQSGHFRPPRKSLSTTLKSFMRLPTSAFHADFKTDSVHYDPAGTRTTKPFRSLRTLKLNARDFKQALKGLRPKAIAGKLKGLKGGRIKGGSLRSGAKGIAGVLILIAIHYGLGRLMEKIENDFIDRQIDELAPKVEEKLLEKEDELDALLAEDSEAELFVNVRFTISTTTTVVVGAGPEGMEEVESMPFVELHSVGFSRQPWDPKPTHSWEHSCGSTTQSTIITASHPINPAELFDDEQPTDTPGAEQPVPQ